MMTFLAIFFSTHVYAADFCTIVAEENFQEFDKKYTSKVNSYSCTDGSKFIFQEESHFNVQTWSEGHSRFFPAFSSKILKTMSEAGWVFKTTNNRENATNFFFHKEK